MIFIQSIGCLRKQISKWKRCGKSVSFVPTMGNLHNGHLKLIDIAKKNSNKVVVSIFVNPIQFDRIEDFKSYPRTLKEDSKILMHQNFTDVLFTPKISTIYTNNLNNIKKQTFLEVPKFKSFLEWKARPNHFRGVSTVISKFFNIINPDITVFGEKDFQQLLLIRKLIKDMCYKIKVISVPTVRNLDGLAYSSRNNLLSMKEKKIASNLYYVLKTCKDELLLGERNNKVLIENSMNRLFNLGLQPDQLEILDYYTLRPMSKSSRKVIALFSAWIKNVRLIDNMQIELI